MSVFVSRRDTKDLPAQNISRYRHINSIPSSLKYVQKYNPAAQFSHSSICGWSHCMADKARNWMQAYYCAGFLLWIYEIAFLQPYQFWPGVFRQRTWVRFHSHVRRVEIGENSVTVTVTRVGGNIDFLYGGSYASRKPSGILQSLPPTEQWDPTPSSQDSVYTALLYPQALKTDSYRFASQQRVTRYVVEF